MKWRVQGTITHSANGWRMNTQVPTFYLESDWSWRVCADSALALGRNTVDACRSASYVSLTVYNESTGEYKAQEWGI